MAGFQSLTVTSCFQTSNTSVAANCKCNKPLINNITCKCSHLDYHRNSKTKAEAADCEYLIYTLQHKQVSDPGSPTRKDKDFAVRIHTHHAHVAEIFFGRDNAADCCTPWPCTVPHPLYRPMEPQHAIRKDMDALVMPCVAVRPTL